MATLNLTHGQPAIPYYGKDRHYRLSNRLDFSQDSVSSGDIVQVLNVKSNTHVLRVYLRLVSAEGTASTAGLGDSATCNEWLASVDLNAVALTYTTTESNGTYGKVYTADDTIDLKPDNNLSSAVIDVYADCLDLN